MKRAGGQQGGVKELSHIHLLLLLIRMDIGFRSISIQQIFIVFPIHPLRDSRSDGVIFLALRCVLAPSRRPRAVRGNLKDLDAVTRLGAALRQTIDRDNIKEQSAGRSCTTTSSRLCQPLNDHPSIPSLPTLPFQGFTKEKDAHAGSRRDSRT